MKSAPETVRNRRGDRGRFLPGCRPGPGRGRVSAPTAAEERLFRNLRSSLNAILDSAPETTWRDVEGALVRLTLLARARRREEEGGEGAG